jgi:hypothetical protein
MLYGRKTSFSVKLSPDVPYFCTVQILYCRKTSFSVKLSPDVPYFCTVNVLYCRKTSSSVKLSLDVPYFGTVEMLYCMKTSFSVKLSLEVPFFGTLFNSRDKLSRFGVVRGVLGSEKGRSLIVPNANVQNDHFENFLWETLSGKVVTLRKRKSEKIFHFGRPSFGSDLKRRRRLVIQNQKYG